MGDGVLRIDPRRLRRDLMISPIQSDSFSSWLVDGASRIDRERCNAGESSSAGSDGLDGEVKDVRIA